MHSKGSRMRSMMQSTGKLIMAIQRDMMVLERGIGSTAVGSHGIVAESPSYRVSTRSGTDQQITWRHANKTLDVVGACGSHDGGVSGR